MSPSIASVSRKPWQIDAEREVEALRQQFSEDLASRDKKLKYPLDIEGLAEFHLGLDMDYLQLRSLFPEVEVKENDRFWGCLTWSRDKGRWSILLDESLAEDSKERPVRFSIAHEVVHFVVDVPSAEKHEFQLLLPGSDRDTLRPRIYCRSSQAQAFIERRANHGAACLLAPREGVLDEYRWARQLAREDPDEPWDPDDEIGLERLVDRIVKRFGISSEATRIRLGELGLVLKEGQMYLA